MGTEMSHPNASPAANLRVLFAAGNGDVAGTLLKWSAGESDHRIMAEAYSAQVYEIARANGWTLLACPNNPCQTIHTGRIAVMPIQKTASRGLGYLVNEIMYGFRLAAIARRFHASLIISATGMHPLGRLALCNAKLPIILSLHNTFWTRGTPHPSKTKYYFTRSIHKLSDRVVGAVCVSEEIKRQAVILGLLQDDKIRVFVPQYNVDQLPWVDASPSSTQPVILFAGRLESSKGVEDILLAARSLEDQRPGHYLWRFAGTGTFLEQAKGLANELRLDGTTHFLGQLDRVRLSSEIANCTATITPTRRSFNEGLAKLPLEGAACGKPAIVSTAVPALDLLGEAAEPTEPSSPSSIARAVERLHSDTDLYLRRHHACRVVREKMTDQSLGYRNALSISISDAIVQRRS